MTNLEIYIYLAIAASMTGLATVSLKLASRSLLVEKKPMRFLKINYKIIFNKFLILSIFSFFVPLAINIYLLKYNELTQVLYLGVSFNLIFIFVCSIHSRLETFRISKMVGLLFLLISVYIFSK